jgi:type II secretion system protein C
VTASRPLLRSLGELALLGVIAWLAATAITTTARLLLAEAPTASPAADDDARRVAPVREPLDAFRAIAARDVFNAGAVPGNGPRLALRVWGVGMHGERGYAVIEDTATGRQSLVQVGEQIGDARVVAVAADRVTVRRGGADEVLAVVTERPAPAAERDGVPAPPAADVPIRQTGPGSFIVERRALTGAVDNTSGLLTQLRAVPEVHDGRPVGFRLFQIKRESLFTQLGLRNGDVVQRVNGSTLADPTSLLGFLERLRDEPRVALDILRGGAPQTLVYDLR